MMDNHFKRKLKQHKVDWDKEALWEELAPQLPQPKSRFRQYWWLLLLLLFIPACWRQLSTLLQPEVTAEKRATGYDLGGAVSAQSDLVTIPGLPESGAEATTLSENSSAQRVSAVAEKPRQTNAQELLEEVEISETKFNSNPSNNAPAILQQDELEVAVDSRESPYVVKESLAENSQNTAKSASFSRTSRQVPTTLPMLDPLPQQMVASITENELVSESIGPGLIRPLKSKEEGVFVSVFGGAGIVQRQDNFSAVEPAIVEYRKAHADRLEPQLAWSVQMETGYRHHSGFSLSTGLGYGQIREQFSFDGIVRVDTFIGNSDRGRYYVKPSGDTLFLTGPGVYTELVNRQVLHNNSLSYYQVPLLLGYHFPKNRWDIELAAGVNYLFRTQYQGRISEGFPATIIDDPALTLRNRWGYTARVGVQYQLLPATYLYLNTQFVQSPEFLRKEVRQRYRSVGMQVGLQYRL